MSNQGYDKRLAQLDLDTQAIRAALYAISVMVARSEQSARTFIITDIRLKGGDSTITELIESNTGNIRAIAKSLGKIANDAGDFLNNQNGCSDEDIAATEHAFELLRQVEGNSTAPETV